MSQNEREAVEIIVSVKKINNTFICTDQFGDRVKDVPDWRYRKAEKGNFKLIKKYDKNGKVQWKEYKPEKESAKKVDITKDATIDNTPEGAPMFEVPETHEEVLNFIARSTELRPEMLIVPDLKWKYLMRQVLRGKNIMMTGPSGCGKTITAFAVADALQRPRFEFNLGSTGDPRSELIGNTHYDPEQGTYFEESDFVRAIQTPHAVILLDELSRANVDAWNILMSVLDYKQRYLRLSDKRTDNAQGIARKVHVAKGVSFIATANIGVEYTATRVLDRALTDRFVIAEMEVLEQAEEQRLLEMVYPELRKAAVVAVSNIADSTRTEVMSEDPKVSTIISTRMSIEMAGLMYDGFSLVEASEVAILPFYAQEEREYVSQVIQGHMEVEEEMDEEDYDSSTPFFSAEEINEATDL